MKSKYLLPPPLEYLDIFTLPFENSYTFPYCKRSKNLVQASSKKVQLIEPLSLSKMSMVKNYDKSQILLGLAYFLIYL